MKRFLVLTLSIALLSMCGGIGKKNVSSEQSATTEAKPSDGGQNRTNATSAAGPTVLARGLKRPLDCLVDATDVYWRDAPTAGGLKTNEEKPDRIMRVIKNGGEPITIVSEEKILAYAVDGTNVYYLTGAELKKIGKDGSSPLILVAKLRNFSPGARIAVDEANVYWLAGSENPIPSVRREGQDQLMKVAKSGGEPVVLATHVDSADGMLVDAKYIYWIESHHMLIWVAKSTGEPEVPAQGTENLPVKIAADQTSIYSMDAVGQIMKVDKNTRRVSKILPQQETRSDDLIVDDANVYWASRSGRIMKLSKNGGNPITLINKQDASSIAVDEKYIYWIDFKSSAVLKLPK